MGHAKHECLTIPKDEALLQFSQVSALPEPEEFNVMSLRNWIAGSFAVRGPGESTWGDTSEPVPLVPRRRQCMKLIGDLFWNQQKPDGLGLVSTDPPRPVDPITRWVKFGLVPFWQNVISPFYEKSQEKDNRQKDVEAQNIEDPPWAPFRKEDYQKPTLATFSDKKLLKVISTISIIVACLLPTLAITALSQLHGLRDLLLCLAGFTCLFAFGLIFFTTGSTTKLEVFVASAA